MGGAAAPPYRTNKPVATRPPFIYETTDDPEIPSSLPARRGSRRESAVAQFFSSESLSVMPPWLLIWILRWSKGERFHKATPQDYRLHFGCFFLIGVLVFLGMTAGEHALAHASAFVLWILATITIVVGIVVCFVWARLVPAAVSLVLGIITWAGFVLFELWKTHIL